MARLSRASVLALAALAACATGCETFGPHSCDTSLEGNPAVTYTGGTTSDGVYMTSAWDGEWLWFPGGQRYSLVHDLGATPTWVVTYLSFGMYGTADGGNVAQAAGNEVEILSVDETAIQVQNTNCAEYYLMVTAGLGSEIPGPQ